jgi:hypothetical protein
MANLVSLRKRCRQQWKHNDSKIWVEHCFEVSKAVVVMQTVICSQANWCKFIQLEHPDSCHSALTVLLSVERQLREEFFLSREVARWCRQHLWQKTSRAPRCLLQWFHFGEWVSKVVAVVMLGSTFGLLKT